MVSGCGPCLAPDWKSGERQEDDRSLCRNRHGVRVANRVGIPGPHRAAKS